MRDFVFVTACYTYIFDIISCAVDEPVTAISDYLPQRLARNG